MIENFPIIWPDIEHLKRYLPDDYAMHEEFICEMLKMINGVAVESSSSEHRRNRVDKPPEWEAVDVEGLATLYNVEAEEVTKTFLTLGKIFIWPEDSEVPKIGSCVCTSNAPGELTFYSARHIYTLDGGDKIFVPRSEGLTHPSSKLRVVSRRTHPVGFKSRGGEVLDLLRVVYLHRPGFDHIQTAKMLTTEQIRTVAPQVPLMLVGYPGEKGNLEGEVAKLAVGVGFPTRVTLKNEGKLLDNNNTQTFDIIGPKALGGMSGGGCFAVHEGKLKLIGIINSTTDYLGLRYTKCTIVSNKT